MNKSSEDLRPKVSSRSLDEELINSILPSYHMFQSTISKRLVPNEENFRVDPPMYELSPMNSGAVTPVASGAMTPLAMFDVSDFPFPNAEEDEDFTQNSAQLFEKTVLANVHKLDNLMDSSNPMASHLDVEITFTDSVCQKGVKPNIIDVSNREYSQDDYLHGFVTMTNRYTEPIPFDIVYVMFEGSLVNGQSASGTHAYPPIVWKFLNMPDLFASWTYANIDRLATDDGNPYDWCEGETDPYDNTVLSIDAKRLFQPGITYKRFFSFRIPDRILDDNCEIHSLDSHCCLTPTLGTPINASRKVQSYSEKKFKDFSFVDTSISYSVSAKIIGRASQYNYKVPKDKFVLTKEANVPIRVLPVTIQPEYPDYWAKNVTASYKAFKDTVERKIEEGELVLLSQNHTLMVSLTTMMSQVSPLTSRMTLAGLSSEKLRHLYQVSSVNHKNHKSEELPVYQNLLSYRKQKLTGYSKVLGVLSLSTPKTTYTFQYIPPSAYRNPLQHYNTQLEIPLELSYFHDNDGEAQVPPYPKSISCELVVLTARSKKHFIPLEFNHEMCFADHVVDDVSSKKVGEEAANFDSLVVKPFHDYLNKLTAIMKKVGFNNDAFRVETQLFKDIKSMAMLQTKYMNLNILEVKIERSSESGTGYYKNLGAVPWEESRSPVNPNYKIFTKNVKLHVDLDSCQLKGGGVQGKKSAFDVICLVPDFQTCFLTRLYYVRISVKHKNGFIQVVHVPVTVEA